MNKLILSLGLAALLTGCDRPAQNTLPERQVALPAQSVTPISAINTEAPAMPTTTDRPADPAHKRDEVKTELDLQAARETPTNQVVISSKTDQPEAGSGPANTESYDGNQVVNR